MNTLGTSLSIDISTLYLLAALVAVMLGLLLLFFWRKEKIAALGWWGIAYLMGGSSVALWTLLGPRLPGPAVLALNMIGFVACGMVWTATRVFHGRKPLWAAMAAGALIWLGVAVLGMEYGTLSMLTGAAVIAVYGGLTASELWRERRKTMRGRGPAVLVPVLHGVVLMLPIVLGELMQSSMQGLDSRSGWVIAFAIELVLYAVGTVFIIFMLMAERVLTAHKRAASVDPLTGLLNRRGFAEATARMSEREARAERSVTVMIFDLDHFKSVNDRFGHFVGDDVLKLFASVLSSNLRITDLVGRVGGEEFAAMLPCSLDEGLIAAERVRQAYAECGARVEDVNLETTVSVGLAGGAAGLPLDVLLASADSALYRAKRAGRNRCEVVRDEMLSLERVPRILSPSLAVRKATPLEVPAGAGDASE
ncbi:MAG: diguanylate cyclase [Xanthobacteraceae bacterium]|nr:MAG: diguanylate cyclase [Xanthobacteraceae bacterium]